MLEIETDRNRTKIQNKLFIAARASYDAEMLFFVTVAFLVTLDLCWALPTGKSFILL